MQASLWLNARIRQCQSGIRSASCHGCSEQISHFAHQGVLSANDGLLRISSFIPVKLDYTDLPDILAFFIGDETGQRGRDDLGERIGRQGKEWAETYWREVDMQGSLLLFVDKYLCTS